MGYATSKTEKQVHRVSPLLLLCIIFLRPRCKASHARAVGCTTVMMLAIPINLLMKHHRLLLLHLLLAAAAGFNIRGVINPPFRLCLHFSWRLLSLCMKTMFLPFTSSPSQPDIPSWKALVLG